MNKNHSHFWISIGLAACILLCIVVLILIIFNQNNNGSTLTLDGYIGAMATLIAICTAIMLGAQIYSIYHRSQTEKEYDQKLEQITDWFRNSTEEYNRELAKLSKTNNTLNMIKYHVNNALGSMHYNEDRKFDGIIDVLENIYILVNNAELFSVDDQIDKLQAACYYIAKNLKQYKKDKLYISKDPKGINRIQERWNKRIRQLDEILVGKPLCDTKKQIFENLKKLSSIFNEMLDGLIYEKDAYRMSDEDMNTLKAMAKD